MACHGEAGRHPLARYPDFVCMKRLQYMIWQYMNISDLSVHLAIMAGLVLSNIVASLLEFSGLDSGDGCWETCWSRLTLVLWGWRMGLNLIPCDLSGFLVLASAGVCWDAWFRHVSQDSHDLFFYQGSSWFGNGVAALFTD
jgi:hypothetical protein